MNTSLHEKEDNIRASQKIAARMVMLHGTKYTPIFLRLEQELEEIKHIKETSGDLINEPAL